MTPRLVHVYHSFMASQERMFAKRVAREINKQYQTAIDDGGDTSNISPEGMYNILLSLYREAFIRWGREMGIFIKKEAEKKALGGQMGASQELYELFKKYFGVEILNVASKITMTTVQKIKSIMAEALKEGFSLDKVVAAIEAQTDISGIRGMLIARTETTAAANAGSFFAAGQTGFEMQKEWYSIKDLRTRADHIIVGGTRIDFDEYFTVGKYKMLHPGDRGGRDGQPRVGAEELCNCRCTLLFYPKLDDKGRLIRRKTPTTRSRIINAII